MCCWLSQHSTSALDMLSKGGWVHQQHHKGESNRPVFTCCLTARLTSAAAFKSGIFLSCPFMIYYCNLSFLSLFLHPSFLPPSPSRLLSLQPTNCCVSCLSLKQISWFFSVMVPPHLYKSCTHKWKNTCPENSLISLCAGDCCNMPVCACLFVPWAYLTL